MSLFQSVPMSHNILMTERVTGVIALDIEATGWVGDWSHQSITERAIEVS